MSGFASALAQAGERVVFLNVLLQQIGVPVPSEPTLVVAGSLTVVGRLSLAAVAGAALTAAFAADLIWFTIGKRYGATALRRIFALSSSPEKYQGRVERLSARWGPGAFMLAKFIPGLPMAGPVLAAVMGTTLGTFLFYDLMATAFWAGTFTTLGIIFHRDVARGLSLIDRLGGWALLLVATLVAWLILRQWHRARIASAAARRAIPATPALGEG